MLKCVRSAKDLDFCDVFGGQASVAHGFRPCLKLYFYVFHFKTLKVASEPNIISNTCKM